MCKRLSALDHILHYAKKFNNEWSMCMNVKYNTTRSDLNHINEIIVIETKDDSQKKISSTEN